MNEEPKTIHEATVELNKALSDLANAVMEQLKPVLEVLQKNPEMFMQNKCSTQIKRELKHEKNPMRIKQLNKELNEAYKRERRHK